MFTRARFLKLTDATLGWLLCRVLGLLNYVARRGIPVTRSAIGDVRRILVIRPGGIGDMIVLLPVLRVLEQRFPEAAIDLACEKRNADVLAVAGFEHDVLMYDSNPMGFLWKVARRRYDVVVDTEQFHHFSAIFALFSSAPTRIGFKINPARNPLYTHFVNYELDGPEGRQFMRLLGPLGITDRAYALAGSLGPVADAIPDALAEDLAEAFGSRPMAVLHAGCSTHYKLWETDRFVATAEYLWTCHGLGVVLVGNRGDSPLADAILAGLREVGCPAVSAAGRLTLRETAALIGRCALFIGADSGLAHLAVAMDRPTVVLFGPSDSAKWGFRGNRHGVVTESIPCSPCFIFGYHRPCRTIDCMKRITVEAVLAECEKVLAAGEGGINIPTAQCSTDQIEV